MKRSLASQLFQTAVVLFGTILCGFAIQLELFSGAGVDPLTMFEEGAGRTLGTATGNVALAVNCFMLLLALLFNRRKIWVGTVITALLLGPSINLAAWMFHSLGLLPPATWPGKLAMCLAGVLLCGAGIAIYMLPDYGVGAMEAVMILLSESCAFPMDRRALPWTAPGGCWAFCWGEPWGWALSSGPLASAPVWTSATAGSARPWKAKSQPGGRSKI